jgi:hypothetical protein
LAGRLEPLVLLLIFWWLLAEVAVALDKGLVAVLEVTELLLEHLAAALLPKEN